MNVPMKSVENELRQFVLNVEKSLLHRDCKNSARPHVQTDIIRFQIKQRKRHIFAKVVEDFLRIGFIVINNIVLANA